MVIVSFLSAPSSEELFQFSSTCKTNDVTISRSCLLCLLLISIKHANHKHICIVIMSQAPRISDGQRCSGETVVLQLPH